MLNLTYKIAKTFYLKNLSNFIKKLCNKIIVIKKLNMLLKRQRNNNKC